MKIELPLNTWEGWVVVPAEIVDIAPHLAAVGTFAVHRVLGSHWQVTELETGGCIAASRSSNTRLEAIKAARKSLASITPEKLEQVHRKAIAVSRRDGYQEIVR